MYGAKRSRTGRLWCRRWRSRRGSLISAVLRYVCQASARYERQRTQPEHQHAQGQVHRWNVGDAEQDLARSEDEEAQSVPDGPRRAAARFSRQNRRDHVQHCRAVHHAGSDTVHGSP